MDQVPDRGSMQLVYRALVRDSLIPCDPRRVGRAALEAMAEGSPRRAVRMAAGFGSGIERDAAYLAARLPDPGPWWHVFAAMAWDSDVPHTAVTHVTFWSGMLARLQGEPLAAPGFFLWRQPDGRLAVVDVDEAGSAHACGLRVGDVLTHVDGKPATRANSQVLPLYVAEAGATFRLGIERAGRPLEIDLVLDRGKVPSVAWRRLEDGVGVVQVRWFASSPDGGNDTAMLVRRALGEMVSAGAPGVVFDLRSGLGGHVGAVAGIAGALCRDEVVVAHREADGSDREVRRAGDPVWLDRPVVVLVNEQTISAAELLALALSELAGAELVGTPTAGGLNDFRQVELGDGYRLVVPYRAAVGPRSRQPRPGHRLEPDVHVANPTLAELVAGRDPPLEAARLRVLRRARGT